MHVFISRAGHRLVPALEHLDEHAHRLLLGRVALGLVEHRLGLDPDPTPNRNRNRTPNPNALGLVEQCEVVERGDVVRVRVAEVLLVDAAGALRADLRRRAPDERDLPQRRGHLRAGLLG